MSVFGLTAANDVEGRTLANVGSRVNFSKCRWYGYLLQKMVVGLTMTNVGGSVKFTNVGGRADHGKCRC